MAWQQTDLDKIDAAIASGIKSVTFADGRKTEYQSVEHMMSVRAIMAAQLQMQAQTLAGKKRNHTPYFKNGL